MACAPTGYINTATNLYVCRADHQTLFWGCENNSWYGGGMMH